MLTTAFSHTASSGSVATGSLVCWHCSQTICRLTHTLLLFRESLVQLSFPNSNAVFSEFLVLIFTVHDSRKCLILDVVRSVVYLRICIMWYAGMPFRKCWLLPVWLLSVARNSVLTIIQIDCYMLESRTLFWDWLMGQLTAL